MRDATPDPDDEATRRTPQLHASEFVPPGCLFVLEGDVYGDGVDTTVCVVPELPAGADWIEVRGPRGRLRLERDGRRLVARHVTS